MEVNAQDEKGNTLLHRLFASFSQYYTSYYQTLDLLLASGYARLTSSNPNSKNLEGLTPLLLAAKHLQRHAIKYASQWNANNGPGCGKPRTARLFDFGSLDEATQCSVLHYICKSPSLVLLMDLCQHASADPLAVNEHLLVCHQFIPKIYVTSRKLVLQWEKSSFLRRLAFSTVPPEEVFSEFEKDHESAVQLRSASQEKARPKIRTHSSMRSLASAAHRGPEEQGLADASKVSTRLALKPLDTSSFIHFKQTQKRAEYRSIRLKTRTQGTSSLDSFSQVSAKPSQTLQDLAEELQPQPSPGSPPKKVPNQGLAQIVATSSRDYNSKQSDRPSIILTRKDDSPVSIEDSECRKSVLLSSMHNGISVCFERIHAELLRLPYLQNSALYSPVTQGQPGTPRCGCARSEAPRPGGLLRTSQRRSEAFLRELRQVQGGGGCPQAAAPVSGPDCGRLQMELVLPSPQPLLLPRDRAGPARGPGWHSRLFGDQTAPPHTRAFLLPARQGVPAGA